MMPAAVSVRSALHTLRQFRAPWYLAPVTEERSLESLMERYVGGDVGAFDELYEQTAPRVFAFLLMMTRHRPRAEDLCQTAYLKLHRARDGWIRGAPLLPWLMAIARNVHRDDARKRSRARVNLSATGEPPERADPVEIDDPLLVSEQDPNERLRKALDDAIAKLTPRQREAFVLTKRSGLSVRDAAQVLGTTEMAVKLRVHRAYVALRASLSNLEEKQA